MGSAELDAFYRSLVSEHVQVSAVAPLSPHDARAGAALAACIRRARTRPDPAGARDRQSATVLLRAALLPDPRACRRCEPGPVWRGAGDVPVADARPLSNHAAARMAGEPAGGVPDLGERGRRGVSALPLVRRR